MSTAQQHRQLVSKRASSQFCNTILNGIKADLDDLPWSDIWPSLCDTTRRNLASVAAAKSPAALTGTVWEAIPPAEQHELKRALVAFTRLAARLDVLRPKPRH